MKAIDFALEMSAQTKAPVTVLTVERVSRSSAAKSPFWDSTLLEAGDAITRAEFKSVASRAKKAGINGVKCATAQGRNVADAIVHYAKKNKHDHIVMGSHGHKGVQRMVLGSIAEAVVAEAPCPVTVVR
jgi:nucleotide-binding universal stress UspA family protein